MAHPTLLAVSHGTSDAAGAAAVAALVARVAGALPDVDVQHAFVNVQQPEAQSALAAIDGPVVVVPLLLSRGFHVHHDLHGMVTGRTDAVVTPALGPDPLLAEVLALRLSQLDTRRRNPVILAVAGSRDPASVEDAEGMAALLRTRSGCAVTLAYLAAREPDLPTVLAEHPDAVVATYLLAQGFFADLAARRAAGRAITAPLLDGAEPPEPLVRLVLARYAAACT